MAAISVDIVIFVVSAVAFSWLKRDMGGCASKAKVPSVDDDGKDLKNSAFVFVKPHANTGATQKLVREKLSAKGIQILKELDIDGKTIDSKNLIDQHYYAIASKATLLDAKDIPVPQDKFKENFGESWDTVLSQERACNAMEACKRFECTADELNAAWGKAKVVKFGGGFYGGLVALNGKELYVFNAFFMSMRAKFVGEGKSIHCYEVQWSPKKLGWGAFRGEVLGPTDPKEAPAGSIRKTILDTYEELGLTSEPNKGDNGVHASASPFEGLAEKLNWLGRSVDDDPFGKALLAAGITRETIKDWSVDPRISMPDGSKGSIFDALEDMDVDECLAKMKELNDLNADVI